MKAGFVCILPPGAGRLFARQAHLAVAIKSRVVAPSAW